MRKGFVSKTEYRIRLHAIAGKVKVGDIIQIKKRYFIRNDMRAHVMPFSELLDLQGSEIFRYERV